MGQHSALHFRGVAVASATNADRHEMRACTETVRAAVWADTTRLYPMGQEGVQAVVDVSFPVAHQPGTTPFVDITAFPLPVLLCPANTLDECIGLFAAVDIHRNSAEEVGPSPSKA